jgi:predicted PurR-regulated permease PerM
MENNTSRDVKKVEISYKTIIFTAVFVASLWFLYFIRDIVLQLFAALLLMAILNPIVNKLSKIKIPKALSIFVSYILIFGLFGFAIGILLPPLVEQTTNLANNLPKYFQDSGISKYANGDVLKEIVSQLGTVPSQVIKAGFSFFTNILNVLTVLIFAFYLLLIRDKFEKSLEFMFGKTKGEDVSKLINQLEVRLGGWARGQLLLMLLIGISSYIGFIILGIPYALPLALLAGIFEIVPYLGPVVASIPAIILGFSISPFVGGATIGLAVLIQQLENYLFVPKIMEKSTGVSPIITLLSLAIGAKLAGITGMVISIPIVIIIQTLLQNRFQEK